MGSGRCGPRRHRDPDRRPLNLVLQVVAHVLVQVRARLLLIGADRIVAHLNPQQQEAPQIWRDPVSVSKRHLRSCGPSGPPRSGKSGKMAPLMSSQPVSYRCAL